MSFLYWFAPLLIGVVFTTVGLIQFASLRRTGAEHEQEEGHPACGA